MDIRPLGLQRHSQRKSTTCADMQDVGRLREPDSAHASEARGEAANFDRAFTAALNFDRTFTAARNFDPTFTAARDFDRAFTARANLYRAFTESPHPVVDVDRVSSNIAKDMSR